jgi:hypothetical protein
MKHYRATHPEYERKRGLKNRARLLEYKKIVFQHYFGINPKCQKCGVSDLRVLQLHHINGGGAEERLAKLGNSYAAGSRFYHYLIKNNFPNNGAFQSYCANCHIILRYEA